MQTGWLRLLTSLGFASLLLGASAKAQRWLWVHGEFANKRTNERYMRTVRQMHAYYQKQTPLKGKLVAEKTLSERPQGRVVFIGPLSAFKHPEWFGVSMEVKSNNEVLIGGTTLRGRSTGVYLRSRDDSRAIYSGLGFAGFESIFSVGTGRFPCTVTSARGKISHQGKWTADGLALEALGFLPRYPTRQELKRIKVPQQALKLGAVWDADKMAALAPEFRKWLGSFVDGQRVLFVGESHWNREVGELFNQIVFELLAQGRVRSVFLELNFSYSAYLDHYVQLADDDAKRFLRERIHPFVRSQHTLALLEILRTWNAKHPKQRVRVACLDMEWGHAQVLRDIVRPYFARLDPDYEVTDPYRGKRQGQLPARLDALLDKAKQGKTQGEYPFLTPEYMRRVVTNLWDTASIKKRPDDRQCFIVRNLRDFHGELLGDGLAVFRGGGYHAVKHKVPGEKFWRDAAWLNEEHVRTKGKVKTLYIPCLGYSFADVAKLDLAKRLSSATKYQRLVEGFQTALAKRSASVDAHYLLNGQLGIFERLLAKQGYLSGRDVVRVEGVAWPLLTRLFGRNATRTRARDYDASIYVLRGKLEAMRPHAPK